MSDLTLVKLDPKRTPFKLKCLACDFTSGAYSIVDARREAVAHSKTRTQCSVFILEAHKLGGETIVDIVERRSVSRRRPTSEA